jgi:hypothetical protein
MIPAVRHPAHSRHLDDIPASGRSQDKQRTVQRFTAPCAARASILHCMRTPGVVVVLVCMLLAQSGCGSVAAMCPPTVDLQSSHDNCGMCEHACGATEACVVGACGSCPLDQALCGGSCVNTDSDAMNCGSCGMACDPGNVCAAGQCQPPCDMTKLSSPIHDPWGTTWDGLERTPAALDVAAASCKAFGARLPTPSELYRVSATQSGIVGQSFQVNYLWSQAPDDKLNQAVIRLSDGGTSTLPAASMGAYRCVCSAPLPKTFTGVHCNGAPGSECFAVGAYNFDSKDRPALRKGAAVWECVNEHAHLADLPELVEAIHGGLPGSGAFISTADASSYYLSTEIRWTATGWSPPGDTTQVDLRTPAPFRCAAPKVGVSPNPNAIPNQFVGSMSSYKGETTDTAAAIWAAAHDACTSRGGHLPRATEHAELILQGLPNGSNAALWSADQTGYNGTQFLAAVNNWVSLDQRYSYVYTGGADGTASWAYKTDSRPFRCIYYPVDSTYVAPTACAGGCFSLMLTGNPAATMWFDSVDRGSMKVADAFADCASVGGHLPSERDFTEAIRAGLPNGSGGYLYTSDFSQLNFTVVIWTGLGSSAFVDQYSGNMTWSDPTPARPYRCMWTNELR